MAPATRAEMGESLDHGGFADTGLADEHGVVLRAAGEHLTDATDLVVAADHRVELALAGAVGQVDPELLERGLLIFLGGRCHLLLLGTPYKVECY
jgi:hypothetical protein